MTNIFDKPPKFIIAGCSNISKRHNAAIDADSPANLRAICDTNPHALNSRFGLYPHLMGFGSLDEMVAVEGSEKVAVVKPQALHADSSLQVLRAEHHAVNEHIVNAPEQGLACYQRTSMDMLVLGNCAVKR